MGNKWQFARMVGDVRGVFLVVTGLMLGQLPGFVSMALAQDDYTEILTTSRTIGDWRVSCEIPRGEEKSCVMVQKVYSGNTGMEVLEANIAKTDKGTLMTLIFPLGVYLPAGVELEVIDHIKQQYEINFCLQNGCYVNQILDQQMVDFLRKKEAATITLNRSADQPVSVPFSIVGFLDAYKEL